MADFKLEPGPLTWEQFPCHCGSVQGWRLHAKARGELLYMCICEQCGTMRVDPYPDAESMERFYRDHYRQQYTSGRPSQNWARTYATGADVCRLFADSLPCDRQRVVYDIGCGTGGALTAFQDDALTHGYDVELHGCDLGEDYLEFGRKQVPRAALIQGTENALEDGRADLVLAIHTLEHRVDIRQALKNHRAKLAPGGTLVVELPVLSAACFHYRSTEQYLQLPHVWQFTPRTFTNLCREVGLSCKGTHTGVFFCQAQEPQPAVADHMAAVDTLHWWQLARADEEVIAEMDPGEPQQLGGLNAMAGVRKMRGA